MFVEPECTVVAWRSQRLTLVRRWSQPTWAKMVPFKHALNRGWKRSEFLYSCLASRYPWMSSIRDSYEAGGGSDNSTICCAAWYLLSTWALTVEQVWGKPGWFCWQCLLNLWLLENTTKNWQPEMVHLSASTTATLGIENIGPGNMLKI